VSPFPSVLTEALSLTSPSFSGHRNQWTELRSHHLAANDCLPPGENWSVPARPARSVSSWLMPPDMAGWGNTVRVIACCSLALVTFAFFTIKARLPQKKGRRALLNFPAFKKPEFVCLTLGGATFSFSFFFFIYFIQTL
jgi:hypothetical protein